MPHLVEAQLLDNRTLPQNNHLLTFAAEAISRESLPGQFLMAAPTSADTVPSPLLKRAFAVYSVGPASDPMAETTGGLAILVKVIGEGTARMAALKTGQEAHLIGPLGKGFDLTGGEKKTHVLLAGGVGIASLYLLAKALKRCDREVMLYYGGRTADDLVLVEDFQALDMPVFLATDDGSAGFKGFVTTAAENGLRRFNPADLRLYACGPAPMLRTVACVAAHRGIPCQVSVEARMACGFGVCLGCSVETRDGYRLTCSDGPVFEASDLVWRG